ncbi:MAG: leucine-rich repeat domain-containing protein [Oligoflexales bacterium]
MRFFVIAAIIFLNSQSALADDILNTEPTTIQEWCERRQEFNEAVRTTIQYFMNTYSNDCEELDSKLNAIEYLSLPRQTVTDLSFIAPLVNLESIDIALNNITDFKFLRNMAKLRMLDLENDAYGGPTVYDFSAFADLTELVQLNLYGAVHSNDLTPLRNLKKLRWLDLRASGEGLSDISGLAGLTNLKELQLEDHNVKDLSPIATLTGLEKLIIETNEIHRDIEMLEPLQNLTQLELSISKDTQVHDYSPLSHLGSLKKLSISSNISSTDGGEPRVLIDDLSFLTGLDKLSHLQIFNLRMKNLNGLPALPNIQEVWFDDNDLTHIDGIEKLVGTRLLIIRGNRFTHFPAMKAMVNLEELIVSSNHVTNIDGLTGLPKVRWLDLGYNELEHVDVLNTLPNLSDLLLDENKIQVLPDMSQLKRLKRVNAGENNIRSIDGLRNCYALDGLRIAGNRELEDISALQYLNLGAVSISRTSVADFSPLANADLGELFSADETPLLMGGVRASEENCPTDASVSKRLRAFCLDAQSRFPR